MSRVLVTGGAGFIGSHVARKLLERGHKVFVVDNMSGGYYENVPPDSYLFNADCADYDQMKMIFDTANPDYVMHLAAYAAEGLSHFIRRFNYTNNLMAGTNIVNLCVLNKIKKLVFTSSMSVFGSQNPPFTEDMPYQPEDPYAISKQAIEQDIKCAHDLWGLDYTIFRPHNVAAAGQNIWDTYHNVIGIFVYQALHDQPLTIFGDGTQMRAFSHIDDVATPIVDTLNGAYPEFLNDTFNVGGDNPCTIEELAEEVKEVVNDVDHKEVQINHLPPRHEVHLAYSSHDKLRKFYRYRSGKTLHDIVLELYQWAKKQPDRPMFTWPKSQIEIMDNLPEKWMRTLK